MLVNSVERHIVARIAGGSSKIERKVLEPQVAIDPPWSYIMDDDKKQDAPIVICNTKWLRTTRTVYDYASSTETLDDKARVTVV
ncbi:hypothetical protein D6D02_05786 [Aureobasidium pullulans]|nr:hypothetical protein D6D03_07559 [Aureobasidium pullulans]THY11385.1 hypothetical protein D6D02_05786 [Aureobasidium pullulans]